MPAFGAAVTGAPQIVPASSAESVQPAVGPAAAPLPAAAEDQCGNHKAEHHRRIRNDDSKRFSIPVSKIKPGLIRPGKPMPADTRDAAEPVRIGIVGRQRKFFVSKRPAFLWFGRVVDAPLLVKTDPTARLCQPKCPCGYDAASPCRDRRRKNFAPTALRSTRTAGWMRPPQAW